MRIAVRLLATIFSLICALTALEASAQVPRDTSVGVGFIPQQSNPYTVGQPVEFIVDASGYASGNDLSGTVYIFINGAPVPGCESVPLTNLGAEFSDGYCTTTLIPAGTYALTATYSGDADHDGSTYAYPDPLWIANYSSATNLELTPQIATFGTPIVMNVWVAGPWALNGTVSLMDGTGSVPGCSAVASSLADDIPGIGWRTYYACTTSQLAVGTHSIIAQYSGSDKVDPSTSYPASVEIDQPVAQTTISLNGLTALTVGQTGTYVATVTGNSPTGSVDFYANGSLICSAVALFAGTSSCKIVPTTSGTLTVSAVYSGDSNNSAVQKSFVTTVQRAESTFVLSAPSSVSVGQQATIVGTITGVSGYGMGSANFFADGAPIAGCANLPAAVGQVQCKTSSLGAGTHQVYGVYSGDAANLPSTSNAVTLTVINLIPPTVQVTLPSAAFKGDQYVLNVQLTNVSPIPIKIHLHSAEQYTSSPHPDEQQDDDTSDPVLRPGEIYTANLPYRHHWSWISPENPINLVEKIRELQNDSLADLVKLALEFAEYETADHIATVGEWLNVALDLASIEHQAESPTATINYVVTTDYDRADAVTLSQHIPAITRTITLSVKPIYQGELQLYEADAQKAVLSIVGGKLLLEYGDPGDVGTDMLLSALPLVLDAKSHYEQAIDPPDPNFTTIALPQPMPLPLVDASANGPFKLYAQLLQTDQALFGAEATSINRAQGAALAQDANWQYAQLNAAGRYAIKQMALSTQISTAYALMQSTITEVVSNGTPGVTADLPPDLVSGLITLGWTSGDIASLADAVAGTKMSALENPDNMSDALAMSTLQAGARASESFQAAAELAQTQAATVSPLTPDDIAALSAAQALVASDINKNVPSLGTLKDISDYYNLFVTILTRTNNYPALQTHLTAMLQDAVAFQAIPSGTSGLLQFFNSGVQNSKISSDGLIKSLNAKLALIRDEIGRGDFTVASNVAKAFANEVSAQRGKKIEAQFADNLVEFTNTLIEVSTGGLQTGLPQ